MVLGLGWLLGGGRNDKDSSHDGSLPDYFPVVPKGCETQSNLLFKCIEEDASQKLRQSEQQQQQVTTPTKKEEEGKEGAVSTTTTTKDDLPPLSLCQNFIVQYQKCCDKQLRKRQNWMLTETYRVQEEYRYNTSNNNKE